MFLKPLRAALCAAPVLLLVACNAAQQAQVTAFEQKAAPVVAQACGSFHSAEADPLVQLAIAGGTAAANAATGGAPVAGLAVSAIKGFGDAFCQAGPPVGDTTTPEQQAQWLLGVGQQLLQAAGAK